MRQEVHGGTDDHTTHFLLSLLPCTDATIGLLFLLFLFFLFLFFWFFLARCTTAWARCCRGFSSRNRSKERRSIKNPTLSESPTNEMWLRYACAQVQARDTENTLHQRPS